MNEDNPETPITKGLKADFQTLHNNGSSDKILATLPALLALRPVQQMLTVDVSSSRAVLTLLKMVAEGASVHVQAAAAVTGIQPRHTGRGVRNDPGPEPREEKAGEIDGRIGRRAVNSKYRTIYFPAYADAVLDLVAALESDETLMMEYQRRCTVPIKRITTYVGSGTASAMVEQVESAQNDSTPWQVHSEASASPVQITDPYVMTIEDCVLDAINEASTAAEINNRRFLTTDMLLALLDLPDSTVLRSFERACPDFAPQLRQQLRRDLDTARENPDYPHWRRFNLDKRAEVLRAKELAHQAGMPQVSELFILLGILDNERSGTRQKLAKSLGAEGFERLRRVATRMIKESESPGPKP